jgi:hypothetical protein
MCIQLISAKTILNSSVEEEIKILSSLMSSKQNTSESILVTQLESTPSALTHKIMWLYSINDLDQRELWYFSALLGQSKLILSPYWNNKRIQRFSITSQMFGYNYSLFKYGWKC